MKKNNKYFIDAWEKIIQHNSFVLACHERADGDALGSALAVANVLKGLDKDVVVLSVDGVTDNYKFIPESDIVVNNTDRRDFDIAILIDCETIDRVGQVADIVSSAKVFACIDHHVPDKEFGEIRIINPDSSSTAELIFEIFEANNIELNKTSANQILTGIISDTGAFRFPNTTSKTFNIAAKLLAFDLNPSEIATNIFDSKSFSTVRMLGRVLSSLQSSDSGHIIWATISYLDMKEFGANDTDTEGFVNKVQSVNGHKVAILFREVSVNNVRVSLRSRGAVDVNKIARVFNGGGHIGASGCTLETSLEEAVELVVGETLKWMES